MNSITKTKQMFPLYGNLVSLRIFNSENITDNYISWLNDPLVVQYSNQRFVQHNKKSCIEYFKQFDQENNLFIAIYINPGDIFIGTMTIYINKIHQVADMGILIGEKKYWGSGAGSESWLLAINFLLNEVKLRKVTAGTLKSNKSMLRVIEKSNMQIDGIRLKHEIFNGKEEDLQHFCIFNNVKI